MRQVLGQSLVNELSHAFEGWSALAVLALAIARLDELGLHQVQRKADEVSEKRCLGVVSSAVLEASDYLSDPVFHYRVCRGLGRGPGADVGLRAVLAGPIVGGFLIGRGSQIIFVNSFIGSVLARCQLENFLFFGLKSSLQRVKRGKVSRFILARGKRRLLVSHLLVEKAH